MDSITQVQRSLVELERRFLVKIKEHETKLAADRRELRRVRKALETLSGAATRFVRKSDFIKAAASLLADNGGQLPTEDLVSLTKLHLKENGYSLSGVDLHITKYLKGAHQLHLATDGTISLKQTEQSSDG
jgi:hypothetical protein